MATRYNFTKSQRDSALEHNAEWLKSHSVDGILIETQYEPLRASGAIFFCENCLFCHTNRDYFDVDHLVPDKHFRDWDKHPEAQAPENMMILCKSQMAGDLGCNQCKGARFYVPKSRGLAFTRPSEDMNCFPVNQRPFTWSKDG